MAGKNECTEKWGYIPEHVMRQDISPPSQNCNISNNLCLREQGGDQKRFAYYENGSGNAF